MKEGVSADVDDLGIASREIEKALEHASSIERPLRVALALSGQPKDVLGDLSAFKDELEKLQNAIKAQYEETAGITARVHYTPPEDEKDG